MPNALYETRLPGIEPKARGKVRDIYDLGATLLFVASDRLSAFDYVLPDPIPDKGRVLCQISEFWFRRFADLVPNHVASTDMSALPANLRAHAAELEGRATIVRKLAMAPVECVVRGYLAGSGWKEYKANGTVCGIRLPQGLEESSRLPEPIFTPATKATTGHDENIPYSEVERLVGPDLAAQLRETSLALYTAGTRYAEERGILIADTKFEFGLEGDRLVLADEVLTPDSSRFWPKDEYRPGRGQSSFDKQYVRDWLEASGWDKQPPVPHLPPEIIDGTRERYLKIFGILTDRALR
jgi:phosphoribosylaminoimidazole-succinocarboxamide synthase